jgi:hypothetical protein
VKVTGESEIARSDSPFLLDSSADRPGFEGRSSAHPDPRQTNRCRSFDRDRRWRRSHKDDSQGFDMRLMFATMKQIQKDGEHNDRHDDRNYS